MKKLLFVLALVAALFSQNASFAADHIRSIGVEGSAFRIKLSSGKVLKGEDLVGATIALAQPGSPEPLTVKVLKVEMDPYDPQHEIELYHMLAVDTATGSTQELCRPDVRGEYWAFPLRGQWDSEGHKISNKSYTLACGGDALGKCVRFGYKPWKTLPNGTRLDVYHQACIRLVRADYCGGHGTTRDGMLIDIYDRIGIQDPDPPAALAAGAKFEAAWTTMGATCVAHTRVPEHETLEQLAKDCPRLKDRLGEAVCTPESAGRWGATPLLFNGSR